jgi:hypothetical protein
MRRTLPVTAGVLVAVTGYAVGGLLFLGYVLFVHRKIV